MMGHCVDVAAYLPNILALMVGIVGGIAAHRITHGRRT